MPIATEVFADLDEQKKHRGDIVSLLNVAISVYGNRPTIIPI